MEYKEPNPILKAAPAVCVKLSVIVHICGGTPHSSVYGTHKLRLHGVYDVNGCQAGPSCSKRRYLKLLVSGQNVNCSSEYSI